MSTGAIPPAGGVGGADHQVQVNSGGIPDGIDNGTAGFVLTSNGDGTEPTFQAAGASGIDQLTGDVTAGPGSGSVAATLANTAVTPASYTNADITVDAKGRITAAANGSSGGGGTVTTTGSPANGNLAKFTGATSVSNADLTGDVTTSGTVATTLANTAVTPASYTNTNLTVDSKGRITAASNGSAGGSSVVVQVKNTQTGTMATGTTAIPIDNTIPQITEGTEFMTLAITPTSSSNKLKIEVVWQGGITTANAWLIVALFQDATANALAATLAFQTANGMSEGFQFTYYMTAGTTSATTFRVRAGANSGTTVTMNGGTSSQFLGGAMISSITITEIIP